MRYLHTLTATVLASTLFACDDGPTSPKNDPGEFSGYIKSLGQTTYSIDGQTRYAVETTGIPDVGFAVVLGTDAEDGTTIAFYRAATTLPSTGNYQLFDYESDDDPAENDFVAIALTQPGDSETQAFCVVRSGTLTITSTADDRVVGTYNVAASCTKTEGGAEYDATFQGAFNSTEGEVGLPEEPSVE